MWMGSSHFAETVFRDTPSHGYADMTDFRLNKLWSADTGSLSSGSAVWTGSGWTGQPLMMKWPKEVKAHMNMTEKAKADDELVEVIYACMDGYVYFLDLRTGEKTRDPFISGILTFLRVREPLIQEDIQLCMWVPDITATKELQRYL